MYQPPPYRGDLPTERSSGPARRQVVHRVPLAKQGATRHPPPPPPAGDPFPAPHGVGQLYGKVWGPLTGWQLVAGGTAPPPSNYTFDTGLTLTGASVNLDPATPTEIGGITEPAADGLFLRNAVGGVFTWEPAAAGTAYVWGIGIDEGPPGTINLIPATAAELGGVTVVARSDVQGLDLAASGALTAPLATDLLAGSIVEPLADGLQYVRTRTAGGVSSWVAATAASFIWGIGIDEDTTTPGTINLIPATATELGGVTVQTRSLTQGLALDAAGDLAAPIATDLLAGSIVEPRTDGLSYARRYDAALLPPAWVWEPTVSAGLQITGLIPEQVIIPSTTPVTVHAFGSEFTATCEILLDGTPVVPPAALISSTEMTFTMDPTPETAMRSVIVTVRDTVGPVAGAGAESFVFAELVESLYRGRWQPATNAPDIGTLVKDDQWMWIADTADPLVSEVAPAGLPGIGGQTINEGDHIIWDATAAVFFNITGPMRDFGTGLAIDRTATPPIVNLTPAGDGPAFLGGVYVVDRVRNVSEGLELGIDGRLRAPLATDSLAGTLLEPPPDDRGYVRRRDASGVSAWVPPADTPLPDYGIGLSLDETATPQIVHLTPAGYTEPGDPGKFLGGVFITPATGLGLNSGTGELSGMRATETTIGMLFDAPFDAKNYVRKDGGWTEATTPAPDTLPIAGNTEAERGVVWVPDDRGLNLDATGQLWLRPATSLQVGGFLEPTDPTNTKMFARRVGTWVETERVVVAGDNDGQKGIVYVPDTQGLSLQQDGRLTLSPTTPSQIGGIIDAPFSDPADPKGYVRQNAAWVEAAGATTPIEYGIGLVPTLDGKRVDLKIAGLNDEIGGVRTFARGPTNALEFDNQTGVISVPLATDRLPGAMVEPDGAMGGQFARTWDGTTGAWTPIAAAGVAVSDTPPDPPTPNQLWFESDTSSLFLRYEDADSSQWIQVNVAAPPNTGVEEAPTDGQQYARQSNAWSVVAASITDAPSDGLTYGRKDAAWAEVPPSVRTITVTSGTLADMRENARYIPAGNFIPSDVPPEVTSANWVMDCTTGNNLWRQDIFHYAAHLWRSTGDAVNWDNPWATVGGGGGLTQADADLRYLQQAGGTVAGDLVVTGDTTIGPTLTVGFMTDLFAPTAGGTLRFKDQLGHHGDFIWGNGRMVFTIPGGGGDILRMIHATKVCDFAVQPTVNGAPIVLRSEADAVEADLLGHITRLMERIEALEGAR